MQYFRNYNPALDIKRFLYAIRLRLKRRHTRFYIANIHIKPIAPKLSGKTFGIFKKRIPCTPQTKQSWRLRLPSRPCQLL